MHTFSFTPSHCVPFRDMEAIERCRNIKREDIEKHSNPKLKIRVVPDGDQHVSIQQVHAFRSILM